MPARCGRGNTELRSSKQAANQVTDVGPGAYVRGMQVRPLDLHDDAQMRTFYDVSWRAEMDDGRPWNGHCT